VPRLSSPISVSSCTFGPQLVWRLTRTRAVEGCIRLCPEGRVAFDVRHFEFSVLHFGGPNIGWGDNRALPLLAYVAPVVWSGGAQQQRHQRPRQQRRQQQQQQQRRGRCRAATARRGTWVAKRKAQSAPPTPYATRGRVQRDRRAREIENEKRAASETTRVECGEKPRFVAP